MSTIMKTLRQDVFKFAGSSYFISNINAQLSQIIKDNIVIDDNNVVVYILGDRKTCNITISYKKGDNEFVYSYDVLNDLNFIECIKNVKLFLGPVSDDCGDLFNLNFVPMRKEASHLFEFFMSIDTTAKEETIKKKPTLSEMFQAILNPENKTCDCDNCKDKANCVSAKSKTEQQDLN